LYDQYVEKNKSSEYSQMSVIMRIVESEVEKNSIDESDIIPEIVD
jgi:hypothetical protein